MNITAEEALEEALNFHFYSLSNFPDAKTALNKLIAMENDLALDRRVSKSAQTLYMQGYKDGAYYGNQPEPMENYAKE